VIEGKIALKDAQSQIQFIMRNAKQEMERAALKATDQAGRKALTRVRGEMAGARLGRLGQGLGETSDLKKGNGVHRIGTDGFSASGVVFIRSGSKRTRGTIEAYTKGAEIRPVRGRWLWIASDQIPRITGRYRMTPELYIKNGFDKKIGPLIKVKGSRGYPVLIVRNVGVSMAGAKRSAKSLTKRGLPRKGQVAQDFIVAFYAIPRTSRAGRVDVPSVMRSVQAELPALFNQAFGAR